jgi:hypothetical protein
MFELSLNLKNLLIVEDWHCRLRKLASFRGKAKEFPP